MRKKSLTGIFGGIFEVGGGAGVCAQRKPPVRSEINANRVVFIRALNLTNEKPVWIQARTDSITLRLIVEENVQEQNNPSAGRAKKKYDRQPGITPNPKIRVHPHQQRSTDNQGSDN